MTAITANTTPTQAMKTLKFMVIHSLWPTMRLFRDTPVVLADRLNPLSGGMAGSEWLRSDLVNAITAWLRVSENLSSSGDRIGIETIITAADSEHGCSPIDDAAAGHQ
jgi:hypothetical protein